MPETRHTIQLPSDRDATGRDLGKEELELLRQAIESGHLNSTGGTLVPRFEREFADRFGVSHAIACASGSAAVHAALGALRLAPGDEVITSPVTDMGAILPILYERATPAFAAVEVATGNVTAETIEPCLSARTRAIIVTHLFGAPCDMQPIMRLAREHGIPVIEDAAQAFLAEDAGELIGSIADLACFSFQQGKHMTTGEGGIVITNSPEHADAVTRFVNKGWGYGDTNPDHDRPGLNYRLTELQAAVAIAQLEKLDGVVIDRESRATELGAALRDLDELATPGEFLRTGCRHSYWRFPLHVRAGTDPDTLGARLAEIGIHNAPRYIRKPAFDCAILRDGAFAVEVDRDRHADTYACLDRLLVLPWNEHYTPEHTASIAREIRAALDACRA